MNGQNDGQVNEPVQNPNTAWIVIASIVITALIVGGGIYAWQNSSLKSAERDLQQQVMNLQNQIGQLQQKQLDQVMPSNDESTLVPPVNDDNLTTYKNQQYGFEFQYPNDWPEPIFKKGGFLSGGFPNEMSKWSLAVGIIGQGPCEGADCAQYEFTGFSRLNYDSALASLRKNDAISEIKEVNINGLKIVTFIEGGLREDQTALIFGSTQTIKFVNVWGQKKSFDQIISTFKFK